MNPSVAALAVIVPVYNGASVLPACFAGLLGTLPADARVHVVDDASPDPSIVPLLEGFARAAPFAVEVVRNARNLGFVGSVNRAIADTRGDVVLLNSDTVPTRGWLEALVRCADSDACIATATPWSNNAEICSLPRMCVASPVPADLKHVGGAVAAIASRTYPELPTGVGFCMFVRRAAVESLGGFDAATFGRGYGEENDFCRRAAGHGWRNVLCDDAFVAHVGHASFAGVDLAPGGINQARLEARYPAYARLVADFIANDPLAPLRERIARRIDAGTGGSRSEAA